MTALLAKLALVAVCSSPIHARSASEAEATVTQGRKLKRGGRGGSPLFGYDYYEGYSYGPEPYSYDTSDPSDPDSYGLGYDSYSYMSYSYGDESFSCALPSGEKGFLCHDKTCIPGKHSCDGHHQCPDGSDEMGCNFECFLMTGDPNGIKCSDGNCVEGSRRCDGHSNCADGSDELGCNFECVLPHGQKGIRCSDGSCIHDSYACDGEAQCPDGSDEMGCGFQCKTEAGEEGWLCKDGNCVAGPHICDGSSNCADGADELGCSFQCTTVSGVKGWKCSDEDETCMGGAQVCDSSSDCPSHADELGCGNGCLAVSGGFGYACKNSSTCIKEEQVCDGESHCPGGDDEIGCSYCSPKCPTFFQGDGFCDLACLTWECGYDKGDCHVSNAREACTHCQQSFCAQCYGEGKCAGRVDASDCKDCKLCDACGPCFRAAPAACPAPEAESKQLYATCAASVFADPPHCPAPCRTAIEALSSSACWAQIRAVAPAGLVPTVEQVCHGACEDEISGFDLPFLENCDADGTASCTHGCRKVLHSIRASACQEQLAHHLGSRYRSAVAACEGCERGSELVEFRELRAACNATLAGECGGPRCAAALVRASLHECWSVVAGARDGELAPILEKYKPGSGCTALADCGIGGAGGCDMQGCELAADGAPARLRAACTDGVFSLAAGAAVQCPAKCSVELARYVAATASAAPPPPPGAKRPRHGGGCAALWAHTLPEGFVSSLLTLCNGGCHSDQPVLSRVGTFCADEAAALALLPPPGAPRVACSVGCQSSLAELNRSAFATACDAAALVPFGGGGLSAVQRACAKDEENLGCVKQFDHLLYMCGYSLETLLAAGRRPACSAKCIGAVEMFKDFSCFQVFEKRSGTRLLEAFAQLSACKLVADGAAGAAPASQPSRVASHSSSPPRPPERHPKDTPDEVHPPPARAPRRHHRQEGGFSVLALISLFLVAAGIAFAFVAYRRGMLKSFYHRYAPFRARGATRFQAVPSPLNAQQLIVLQQDQRTFFSPHGHADAASDFDHVQEARTLDPVATPVAGEILLATAAQPLFTEVSRGAVGKEPELNQPSAPGTTLT